VDSKYREYIEKVNLTEEAKARTNQLLNELALISLIFESTGEANQRVIKEKLQEVDKELTLRLKGQGWMSYFSRTSEVVTL
jgi:uncharacterized ferritin-like protein (DUF455 family)